MKRILIAPWLFSSHSLPMLTIAEAIRRRGHAVYFYGEEAALGRAREAGCVPLSLPVDGTGRKFGACTTTAQACAVLTRQAERVAPHLAELLTRHRIDAVLVDALHPGAALAAEASGRPWGSFFISPSLVSAGVRSAAQARLKLGPLRKRLRLEPTTQDSLQQATSEHLVLLPWTQGFVRHRAPRGAVHVGPLNWEAPPKRVPRWLRDLGRERPLVLVGLSTIAFRGLEDVANRYASEAVASLNVMDVDAVVTLVSGNYTLREAPASNVRLEQFVPHSYLVPRASVVVTQGGWGTIGRALAAGVPLVLVPFATDQPFNAALCEEAGVGFARPGPELTAEWLCDRLHRLLAADAPQRRQARRFEREISRLSAAEQAAERVLELAS